MEARSAGGATDPDAAAAASGVPAAALGSGSGPAQQSGAASETVDHSHLATFERRRGELGLGDNVNGATLDARRKYMLASPLQHLRACANPQTTHLSR